MKGFTQGHHPSIFQLGPEVGLAKSPLSWTLLCTGEGSGSLIPF